MCSINDLFIVVSVLTPEGSIKGNSKIGTEMKKTSMTIANVKIKTLCQKLTSLPVSLTNSFHHH